MKTTTSLQLDSVLLFVLVIPFIMGYRLSSGQTPHLLFGLIFLSLLLYIALDITSFSRGVYELCKKSLLWLIIFLTIGSAFVSAMIVRHQTHPIYMVHDILIQQESAIRFLLDGKNPYKETYFATPLAEWHFSDKDTNPALYHFVMEPFYVLFALPFYFIANHTVGFFDGRMPLLFLFLCILFLGSLLIKDENNKRSFLVLFAFHPAILPYTLEGRSDIFMYAFMFSSFYFLTKGRFTFSSMLLGLACVVKQSAWPLLPLYFVYLFFKTRSIKKVLASFSVFAAVFLATTSPFFLWDKEAFIASTLSYLSGNTSHSYPISGYGFGSLLLQAGVIVDKSHYYPFIFWQALISIPVFLFLVFFIRRQKNVRSLIFSYAFFLFVYWYFSRYFHNSHVAFISLVFLTAYFWPTEDVKRSAHASS